MGSASDALRTRGGSGPRSPKRTPQAAIFTSLPALALSEVIAWWIPTGTLECFPGLQIVFVEPSLYWIPASLSQLDRKADGRCTLPGLRLKPSEYFHRNMACTFMDDDVGLSMRHLVGIENILWSTDFPHPATTWPHSREVIATQFADVSEGTGSSSAAAMPHASTTCRTSELVKRVGARRVSGHTPGRAVH